MRSLHPRTVFSLLFLSCVALLSYGYYLQYVDGLEPCNLCIFERVAFASVAVVSFIGWLHGNTGYASRLYFFLSALAAACGAAIAARHVWIQNLPEDKIPECGPGLDYLLQAFPLQHVIQTVLKGSGDCAEVSWQFLSLSLPAWALVWFVGILFFCLLGAMGGFRKR